jgi:hypothetical protein
MLGVGVTYTGSWRPANSGRERRYCGGGWGLGVGGWVLGVGAWGLGNITWATRSTALDVGMLRATPASHVTHRDPITHRSHEPGNAPGEANRGILWWFKAITASESQGHTKNPFAPKIMLRSPSPSLAAPKQLWGGGQGRLRTEIWC